MLCSRRNVNMACDVDFISMSRNGHALPKIDKMFKANNFYLKAMRTYLSDPKAKHSFAVTLLHGLSEVWVALKGMAFGLPMSKKGVNFMYIGLK